jgi:TPR repeat protein
VTAFLFLAVGPAAAFDGSSTNAPAKISPRNYASAEQALRAGLDDLNAGDAVSGVDALTYAAEGGQAVARWKLGEMYADGVGVARDDVKAYHFFNRLVQDYDEDALDPRNRGAVSSAFVAVGVYSLTGIPNSDVRSDPERARELFQYAASTFGDPDAQYNLAHMYMVGAGGLAQDKLVAIRWLMLASGKGHWSSQALLGHLLFVGDGVLPQRAKGLMWLTIANKSAEGPQDEWIRELYRRDSAAASAQDHDMATAMLEERAKGPSPSAISHTVVHTLQILRPLGVPVMAAAPGPSLPSLPASSRGPAN